MLEEHFTVLRDELLTEPPSLPEQMLVRHEAEGWPPALAFLNELQLEGDELKGILRVLAQSNHPWPAGAPLGWEALQRAARALPPHGMEVPGPSLPASSTALRSWQHKAEARSLAAAFLHWDADPAHAGLSGAAIAPDSATEGLPAARRTYLLLALVGEDVPPETGLVAELLVRRVPVEPHSLGLVPFYRAPACQLQVTDASFDLALERAGRFIAELLRSHGHPDDDIAFEWDVRPLYHPPSLPVLLQGGSGGAAMLCAALSLVTERLPAPWPALLCNIDWARVGVSAALAATQGELDPVDALGNKLNAWSVLPPRLQLRPTLFVHDHQGLTQCARSLKPQRAGTTVLDLVGTMARHTGLALTDEQAALYAMLQQGSSLETEAEKNLLWQVAEYSPSPARSLAGYLLHRFARRAAKRRTALGDAGSLHINFVRLQIQPQWLDGEEDTADADKGTEERRMARPAPQPLPSLAALVDDRMLAASVDQRRADGWLIMGRPGAGKTTLLAHFEMTEARRALLEIAQGQVPVGVCIWVDILDASELHAQGAAAWMRKHWENRCAGIGLPQLLQRHRPRFVFDAINEMRLRGQRPQARQREDTARELAMWCHLQSPNAERPIFSVRELERVNVTSRHQFIQPVELLPWDLPQMREYCKARLGPGHALEPLLAEAPEDPGIQPAAPTLVADTPNASERRQLQDLLSLPFNLAGQCTLLLDKTFGTGQPARDRAELMCSLVWLALRREVEQGQSLAGASLLDELTRGRLGEAQRLLRTRDQLLELPTDGDLMQGLQRTALAMLRHKGGEAADWHLAESEVPCGLQGKRRVAWLKAVMALGLCELQDLGAGEKRFRFTPQTWQEFFGARALLADADWPDDQLRTPMRPSHERVLELKEGEALPPAPVSGWEEPMKFAAQLHPRPHELLARLAGAPHTLALAGRAAAPSALRRRCEQSPGGPQVLEDLRWALVRRSRDADVDVLHRIEAALALGDIGDPRYREHRDPENGSLLCLVPDERHWMHMDAALHTIGAADDDPEAYNKEKPALPIHLPAFEMAWAPVTNAEFALFIADRGYDPGQPWWQQVDARRWIRGELHSGWELMDDGLPATARRQPASWSYPRFNQSAQPVTGISLYEAHAYCQWLNGHLDPSGKGRYRLPTEAEFEAVAKLAARSPARESFDWCNSLESHLDAPAPAGCFPGSDREGRSGGDRQPLGVADLSGNVLQWTLSRYTDPFAVDALTEVSREFDPSVARVVRSGAWGDPRQWCRASFRLHNVPLARSGDLGFRLVRCPIHEP